jgi:hypothetical protein
MGFCFYVKGHFNLFGLFLKVVIIGDFDALING